MGIHLDSLYDYILVLIFVFKSSRPGKNWRYAYNAINFPYIFSEFMV